MKTLFRIFIVAQIELGSDFDSNPEPVAPDRKRGYLHEYECESDSGWYKSYTPEPMNEEKLAKFCD